MNFLNRINKIRVARYVFAVAPVGALFRVLPVYVISAGKVTPEYITAATRFRCEESHCGHLSREPMAEPRSEANRCPIVCRRTRSFYCPRERDGRAVPVHSRVMTQERNHAMKKELSCKFISRSGEDFAVISTSLG